MLPKEVKRFLRRVYNQKPKREITSLMDDERIGDFSEDGEYFCVYGFLPEFCGNFTDDEIKEYLDEYMRETFNSPYDCTGWRFTLWIDFHRNPCGRISYVHRMGIDV